MTKSTDARTRRQQRNEVVKTGREWLAEMTVEMKLLTFELRDFNPRELPPDTSGLSRLRAGAAYARWRRREKARALIEGLEPWPPGPLMVWKALAEEGYVHLGRPMPVWWRRRPLADLVGRRLARRLDRTRRQSDLWSCSGSSPALRGCENGGRSA